MRKWGIFLLALTYASGTWAGTTGRGGIYFGKKSLNNSDWGNLDSQPGWGINMDVKEDSWPVWATLGYYSSRDEITVVTSVAPFATTEIAGKTSEIQFGVKKDFRPVSRVLFSLSGGPVQIRASLDNSVSPFNSDSDSALGYWGGADVILFLQYLSLGVSYKFSKADVDLLGQSRDAGGANLAFSVGFGW